MSTRLDSTPNGCPRYQGRCTIQVAGQKESRSDAWSLNKFDPSTICAGDAERSGALDRLGHVPGGGSPTAPVPTRTEEGQVTKYDPNSTETDRELE